MAISNGLNDGLIVLGLFLYPDARTTDARITYARTADARTADARTCVSTGKHTDVCLIFRQFFFLYF
jgi:hypothetical protein